MSEGRERISLIDKATDLLRASVDNLTSALALFLTGWFAAKFVLDEGKIEDTKKNYDTINQLDEAKASFFDESVVPFLAGISLVFWNIQNLNKQYFETVADETQEDLHDDIVESISSAFGFKVSDTEVELAPGGWLTNVGDLKSVYDKVRESAMKAVSSKVPMTDFLKTLRTEIEGDETISGLLKNHFKTIIWDVYSEFDRMVSYKFAISLGYRAAIYEGGTIDRSRDFCIERNGEVFTFDEIRKFGTPEDTYDGYSDKSTGEFDGKPRFDYDPFFDQGGHNCRHAYSYIPDRLAVHLRPDIFTIPVTKDDYELALKGGDKFYGEGNTYEEKTLSSYTGTGFEINNDIRNGTVNSYGQQYILNLDRSLQSLPKFNDKVYRGLKILDGSLEQKLIEYRNNINGTVTWDTFVSGTRLPKYAYGKGKFAKLNLFYTIRAKTARRIDHLSLFPTEKEVLFPRNTKFRILRVWKNVVHLEEI